MTGPDEDAGEESDDGTADGGSTPGFPPGTGPSAPWATDGVVMENALTPLLLAAAEGRL